MKGIASQTGPAVVYSGEAAARAVEAHLGTTRADSSLRWYEVRDLHDLDRAVRDGQVTHVLLGGLSDLLDGMWEHEIDLSAWGERGVRIEVVPSTTAGTAAGIAERATSPSVSTDMSPSILTLAQAVDESWRVWRARYRRRSLLTAGVITALVLALCFLVNLVIGG